MRSINWIKGHLLKLWSKVPRKNGKIDFNFIVFLIFIIFIVYSLFFGQTGGEGCSWWYDTDC